MTDSRSGGDALDVLFIWHFHQPYYGIPDAEEFVLPWVRLHAVKSYYDMGRLLERWPRISATVNFSGSLLRQIREYVDHDKRDRWWRWSSTAPRALELAERRGIVRNFFSLNIEHHVEPSPRYRELYQRRRQLGVAEMATSLSDQELLDLQVLFNLHWCGFAARDDFPLLDELRQQDGGFSPEEKDALLDLHLELLRRLLPLYRKLARRQQIEICASPMYHPIIPLVIDTDTAARPSPDRPRPTSYRAPRDAAYQLKEALDFAEDAFGERPTGMWPSEGSVSPEAVKIFAEAGVEWIATDEEVLCRSRGEDWQRDRDLWRPWRVGDDPSPRIFFRDRGLSDRIGFSYSELPADEAADDLVGALVAIGDRLAGRRGCVSIILDGENPWEHYPDDGRHFLEALYERLESARELRTRRPSQISNPSPGRLDHLHSGSWIMANFDIWIGHQETNEAWEWLRRADELLEKMTASNSDHGGVSRAREHLRIAQGSDWFWWYGDDFTSEQDDQFDALFRALISGVWTCLEQTPPSQLGDPIYRDSNGSPVDGTAIATAKRFISPTIDGQIGEYFDWNGAGQIDVTGAHGSMFESVRPLQTLLYGFSPLHFFLQLQPGVDFTPTCRFQIRIKVEDQISTLRLAPGDHHRDLEELPGTVAVFDDVAEASFPLHRLGLSAGDHFELAIGVECDGLQLQRFPRHGGYPLEIPKIDPGLEYWIV